MVGDYTGFCNGVEQLLWRVLFSCDFSWCFWGRFLVEILLPLRRDAIFHFFLTGSFRLDFGPPGGVEIGMKKSKIGMIARAKIFKKSLKKVVVLEMVFWSSEGVQKASKIDGIFEKIG